MTAGDFVRRTIARSPLIAAALYAAVVLMLVIFAWSEIADLIDRNADVRAASEILERLQGRQSSNRRAGPSAAVQSGSWFLEGATVTVAGAALLQRVSSAVTKLGGNVLSTQIDMQGTQSKAGFLTVIANCDIDQPGLQRLLYDIEAGQPFLFVDQLVAQAPASFAASGDGKLRVLLAVSGQWQGAK